MRSFFFSEVAESLVYIIYIYSAASRPKGYRVSTKLHWVSKLLMSLLDSE